MVRHRQGRGVVAVAEVVEFIRGRLQRGLGAAVRLLELRAARVELRHLTLEFAQFAHAGEGAAAGFGPAPQHAVGREDISTGGDEGGGKSTLPVHPKDLGEIRHQVDRAEQRPRDAFESLPHTDPCQKRFAQGDEAL